MRFRTPVILLCLVAFLLVGCAGTPLSTDPYRPLSTVVSADDLVVTDATVATQSGILPAPDAAAVYNAEQLIVLGLPTAVTIAGQTGSPTAPNAVTLPTLEGQIAQLSADVAKLHSIITAAGANLVKAAKQKAAAP